MFVVLFVFLGFQIWIVYFSIHKSSSLSSSPYFFTRLLVPGVEKICQYQITRGGLWEVGPKLVCRWKVSDKDLALLQQEIVQVLKESKEEQSNEIDFSFSEN